MLLKLFRAKHGHLVNFAFLWKWVSLSQVFKLILSRSWPYVLLNLWTWVKFIPSVQTDAAQVLFCWYTETITLFFSITLCLFEANKINLKTWDKLRLCLQMKGHDLLRISLQTCDELNLCLQMKQNIGSRSAHDQLENLQWTNSALARAW